MKQFAIFFLETLMKEQETVEEILKIDNESSFGSILFSDFYHRCNLIFDMSSAVTSFTANTLILTEGSPYDTLKILTQVLLNDFECILFIHEEFIGLNQWIVKVYNQFFMTNIKVEYGINYNVYIGQDYYVIPYGEPAFVKSVIEDFQLR